MTARYRLPLPPGPSRAGRRVPDQTPTYGTELGIRPGRQRGQQCAVLLREM
jgi:hypothetical protein